VSGVSPGIVVLDRGLHPRGKGRFWEGVWTVGSFSGVLVLMAFLGSFEREIVFGLCVKSLQYFRSENILMETLFTILS